MRNTISYFLFLGFAWSAGAAECEYRKSLDFSVPADRMSSLNLKAGAGRLMIEGQPRDDVVVTATACASSQKRLDSLQVSHVISGDQLRMEARQVGKDWNWSGNAYGYIDLDLQVPSRLSLSVVDGSGHAEISGVASLYVEDGSGGLTIERIGGDVQIEDGSGHVDVRDIDGNLSIEDGSGNLEFRDIRGSVLVEDDGSGSMEIHQVALDVRIEDDGSGSIRISDVGGDVWIGDDGAGAITVRDVDGDFRVDDDSNGGISYGNVKGSVQIPKQNKRHSR